MSEENIKKIVDVYKHFKEIEKFSKIITAKQATEVNYNLSPSRFVSVTEEEKYRPIREIVKDLKEVEGEREKVEERIKIILKKIKYECS